MSTGKIRVGIGGWTYEPWRGVFYPQGLPHKQELTYAAGHLSSIEVNGTFYKLMSPALYGQWHDETPDGFVFSLKAPRFCTNRKALATAGETVQKFVDSGIQSLRDKLGSINWQLPPTKTFDAADVEAFFKLLPTELRHAIEVRHESFKCEEFVELARKYRVAIVLTVDSEYPVIADPTAPFIYIRLKGTTEGANGYEESQLQAWADRAKTFATGSAPTDLPTASPKAAAVEPRDVFVYFIGGFKQANPNTAMALTERLK